MPLFPTSPHHWCFFSLRYNHHNLLDIYSHLTNTARAAETKNFDETKFVKTLRDLPDILLAEYPDLKLDDEEVAEVSFETGDQQANKRNLILKKIKSQLHAILHDLFQSYENEYSIFLPMSNCFELFGLDFLIDEDLNVHFLECNPGPDFKQTGNNLHSLINNLFEQVFRLVLDNPHSPLADIDSDEATAGRASRSYQEQDEANRDYLSNLCPDMTLVYSKEWSVNQLKNSMSFH
jgi:hypothetical protein